MTSYLRFLSFVFYYITIFFSFCYFFIIKRRKAAYNRFLLRPKIIFYFFTELDSGKKYFLFSRASLLTLLCFPRIYFLTCEPELQPLLRSGPKVIFHFFTELDSGKKYFLFSRASLLTIASLLCSDFSSYLRAPTTTASCFALKVILLHNFSKLDLLKLYSFLSLLCFS